MKPPLHRGKGEWAFAWTSACAHYVGYQSKVLPSGPCTFRVIARARLCTPDNSLQTCFPHVTHMYPAVTLRVVVLAIRIPIDDTTFSNLSQSDEPFGLLSPPPHPHPPVLGEEIAKFKEEATLTNAPWFIDESSNESNRINKRNDSAAFVSFQSFLCLDSKFSVSLKNFIILTTANLTARPLGVSILNTGAM